MIIDNRNLLPIGSFVMQNPDSGQPEIFIHTVDARLKNRYCALVAADIAKKKKVGFAIVRDVVKAQPFGKRSGLAYPKNMLTRLGKCHQANTPRALECFKEYPEGSHLFLVGAGPIPKEDLTAVEQARGTYKIVTVGQAITQVLPDYHVMTDSTYPIYLENMDLSSVDAYLATICNPQVSKMDWKSIGWFTHETLDGVPLHFAGESVTMDALQFIFGRLKATKLIMLGMEHPVNHVHNQHFWAGLGVQAYCYWYSQHNREIWNCSRPTTVLGGVIIGSVADAIQ